MPANMTEQPAHPPTFVPGQPFQLPQINLAEAEGGISAFVSLLPILATVFPPLAVIVPFIPIIQGLLKMGQALQSAGHDPQAIATVLSTHLQQISSHAQAAAPGGAAEPAAAPQPT